MATKKKSKSPKTRKVDIHKVAVVKVAAPTPDAREVTLRVEGPPEALPEPFHPDEPVPLKSQMGLLDWLSKVWKAW